MAAPLTWRTWRTGPGKGWIESYTAANSAYSIKKTGTHKHTQNWQLSTPDGTTRHSTLRDAKSAAQAHYDNTQES